MELKRLTQLLSLTDYTSLNHTDTFEHVEQFCTTAIALKNESMGLPGVAAICVYPAFLEQCLSLVRNVYPVAVVAGGFPHAQLPFRFRLHEIVSCAERGADEIDIVVPYHQIAPGHYGMIEREIRTIKNNIGFRCLKVILETGLLSPAEIQATAMAALDGGADFVKTLTGKNGNGASLSATAILLAAIDQSQGHRGIKPSGGIRTIEQADAYATQFEEVFGASALTARRFRIGASSLVNEILQKMQQEYGVQV